MSLFDKIFGGKAADRADKMWNTFWKTFSAYSPVFTNWGGQLYESELVRSAIHARASHISKLKVEVSGSAQPKLQTRLRSGPNEFQTWGQFLYRTSTILDVQNTAFIVPVQDAFGGTTGIYTVLPSRCELLDYHGEPWLRYRFSDGSAAAIELASCGVMTRMQYSDDLFGESNRALNPTMELIHVQNQGIEQGVKNAASFRFMAKMTNFAKEKDIAKERKRFDRENLQADSSGGLLLFPNIYSDIKQIDSKPFVVDADQMNVIQTNVYNYFGVNEDILQNKAYGDAWSAFYEGAVEQFAIQFSDVVTAMLFTGTERAHGTCLMATANRLQYMSNAEKLNVSQGMMDRGIMNRDEIREMWNLKPLPNGEGQKYFIRGEYYESGSKIDSGTGQNEGA